MKDKFCVNRTLTYLMLLVVVVVGFFWVIGKVNLSKTSKNTEAAGTCTVANGCGVQVPARSGNVQYYCFGKTAPQNTSIPGQVCSWSGTAYVWVPGPTKWPTSTVSGGQAQADCEKYTGCWTFKNGASPTTGYCQKRNTCSPVGQNYWSEGFYCSWDSNYSKYAWHDPPRGILCTRQPTLTPRPTVASPTRWPTPDNAQIYNCALQSKCYDPTIRSCIRVGQCVGAINGTSCTYDLSLTSSVSDRWKGYTLKTMAGVICTKAPTLTPKPTAVAPTRWPTLEATNQKKYECAIQNKCYYQAGQTCVKMGSCVVDPSYSRGSWCNYDRASATPKWWNGYVIVEPPEGINCNRVPTPTIP